MKIKALMNLYFKDARKTGKSGEDMESFHRLYRKDLNTGVAPQAGWVIDNRYRIKYISIENRDEIVCYVEDIVFTADNDSHDIENQKEYCNSEIELLQKLGWEVVSINT